MSEPAQGVDPMTELCRHLDGLTQAVRALQEGYTRLENRVQALSAPSTSSASGTSTSPSVIMLPPEPKVPMPERFSGERSKYRAFRNACELYFALQPRNFSLEATKVGFVISLLYCEPQAWAHRLMEQKDLSLDRLDTFFQAMSLLYEDPHLAATAEAALHALQQGRRPAEDYVSEFRRWSADTNWNNAALCYQFRLGLSETLKDELARVGVPETLEALINLTIQIDRRLRERRTERATGLSRPAWMLPRVPTFPNPSPPAPITTSRDIPEPMQLGLIRPSLTSEERLRRRTNNLCLYCGEPGHYVRTCPAKYRKSTSLSSVHTPVVFNNSSHLAVPVLLQLPGRAIQTSAILDSGACSCFLDSSFAIQHHIPLRPRAIGLSVHLADGSVLKSGPVTQETLPIATTISDIH